jgi:Tfp pilus assembly protein PilF
VSCAYSGSLNGPFVLDDIESIPGNPSIRRLWPLSEVLTGATFATVVGRPLLNLSLALDFALHGTEVRGYHLFNILAHILAGWALFGVVHRTLQLTRYREKYSPKQALGFATVAALLWTLHPLATAAVTYIVQRGEVLAALWSLTALYCSIRGAEASSSRSRFWNGLAVVCCFIGVGTKETIVTAPLVILLYDTTFLAGSIKRALRQRSSMYLGLFGSWIALAALMKTSAGRSGTAGIGYGMNPLDYAVSQFGYVLTYLKLSIWPHPLIFDYGDTLATTPAEFVIPGVILLILMGVLLAAARRWPVVGFLGISTFLILAPTSTIVPLVTQTAAEHRMYLPLAAVVTLMTLTVASVVEKIFRVDDPRRAKTLLSLAAVSALVLAGATWLRNRDYHTEETLWFDTVQKRPVNARSHNNLGRVYLEQGKRGAREELEAALRLNPQDPAVIWHNLGLACFKQQDFLAALHSFNEAIAFRPRHVPSYVARSQVYGALRNDRDELSDLNRAIELDSRNGEAYLHRALLHADQSRYSAAWSDLQRAQRLGTQPPAGFVEQLRDLSPEPK